MRMPMKHFMVLFFVKLSTVPSLPALCGFFLEKIMVYKTIFLLALLIQSFTTFADETLSHLWYSEGIDLIMSSEKLGIEKKRNMYAINDQDLSVKVTHLTDEFEPPATVTDSVYLGYGKLCEPAYLPCGSDYFHLWASPMPAANKFSAVIDYKIVHFNFLSKDRHEYGDMYYLGLGVVCGLKNKPCIK